MDTAVLISCLALVGTLLIVLLLLCRLVQPYDIAWFLSNREDKLNLSKMRLYNANGYLMHSGSEILLGSTGSFRRFDSVDRDYKPQYHHHHHHHGQGPGSAPSAATMAAAGGGGAVVVPPWRHSIDDTTDTIPPQPLRPAPSPREAKLSRSEKPIHRQTSEPKPASRSIIISPIPRPVPRKQHSAPISFPLPLLASPRDKRTNQPAGPTTLTASTNPFVVQEEEDGPLLGEDRRLPVTRGTTVRARPQPSPLPPPAAAAAVGSPSLRTPHTTGSVSVFRSALKSANNPFLLDSPTLALNRHNQPNTNQQPQQQQQQQQQQQPASCVFNFDPAMVHSLFNRPVPGLGTMVSPTPPPVQTTTIASTTPVTTTTTTTTTCTVEEDPLRRAEKRLSKMENLRKMSRLIESNQLLLNIYQQFNRTITEQPEETAGAGARAGTPPSPSPPSVSQVETAGETTSPSAPSSTEPPPPPPSSSLSSSSSSSSRPPSSATVVQLTGSGELVSPPVRPAGHNRYHDSPRTDALDCIRVPTVSRGIKHILRNRSFSETEFSERTLIKSFALLAEQEQPVGSPPHTVSHPSSQRDLTRGYVTSVGGTGSGSGSTCGAGERATTAREGQRSAYQHRGSNETLHKTVSESFLGQYFSFGSERFRSGSSTVLPSSSCESVASQSSVVFADLVHADRSPTQPVAGYLCIALQPDKSGNTAGKQESELVLTVQEAKDLVAGAASVPTSDSATETETFVRVLLRRGAAAAAAANEDGTAVQTTVQTKVSRGPANRASFHETFSFWINANGPTGGNGERPTLAFQVYQSTAPGASTSSSGSHTLIGEAELQLTDAIQRPLTTWLKLSDASRCRPWPDLGELMFSLSYLPTAERLTVVVVKARNLALKAPRHPACPTNGNRRDSQAGGEPQAETAAAVPTADPPDSGGSVFVKVYLLQNDQKVSKKKTSVRRAERCPIYNEAIIFSVPPYLLNAVQIRLSVVQMLNRTEMVTNNGTPPPPSLDAGEPMLGRRKSSIKLVSLGHVIIGSGTTGKALRHWHQMLTALRKPVAMWHGLRSSSDRGKPSATDLDSDQPPKARSE